MSNLGLITNQVNSGLVTNPLSQYSVYNNNMGSAYSTALTGYNYNNSMGTLGMGAYPSFSGSNYLYGGINQNLDVGKITQNLEDRYAVQTTQQSFGNQQKVESLDFARQAQTIQYLMKQGRSDAAIAQFKGFVDVIGKAPQYANYTEPQRKSLAQTLYTQATGTTLAADAAKYCDSSFMTGIKNGVPGLNLLVSSKSRDDVMAEITDTPSSSISIAQKFAGTALTGGVGFLTLSTVNNISKVAKENKALKAAGGEATKTLGDALKNTFKGKTGKAAIGTAILGGAVAVLGFAAKNLFFSDNKTATPTT